MPFTNKQAYIARHGEQKYLEMIARKGAQRRHKHMLDAAGIHPISAGFVDRTVQEGYTQKEAREVYWFLRNPENHPLKNIHCRCNGAYKCPIHYLDHLRNIIGVVAT